MKLCRFQIEPAHARVGLLIEAQTVLDLSRAGIKDLTSLLEHDAPAARLAELSRQSLPRHQLDSVRLLAPLERQEVWAAGVTYLRSKTARMQESDFSATAYDQVYAATRPELFFKALAEKVVGPGEPVGIRQDARWSVPEPELALVLDSRGRGVAYTIGNDMSSRDIEGENLLYLPQAKIYERSCALGPFLVVGPDETEARQWEVELQIERAGTVAFKGQTGVGRIKRGFAELAQFLFRSQRFPHGAVLLTGTGIVPGEEFTLQAGDRVRITISGIGALENPVITV